MGPESGVVGLAYNAIRGMRGMETHGDRRILRDQCNAVRMLTRGVDAQGLHVGGGVREGDCEAH